MPAGARQGEIYYTERFPNITRQLSFAGTAAKTKLMSALAEQDREFETDHGLSEELCRRLTESGASGLAVAALKGFAGEGEAQDNEELG